MHAALEIARKDLRLKVRDRSALLLAIVAPFALAALFSSVLGGVEDGFHARWTVVDLDGGAIAKALEDGPLAAMEASGTLELARAGSTVAARRAIEEGRSGTAIIIPEGFSAGLQAGSGASVELLVAPDATISGQVARSVLSGFGQEVEAVRLSVLTALGAAGQLPDPESVAALGEAARAQPDPIVLSDGVADAREVPNSTYYAASMAVFFVFLAAQFGLVSLHAEKRNGTLARMLAAPLPWWSVVAGKVLVSIALALISLSVIILGTSLLLGARWGDPTAVATLVVAAAVAATGIASLAVAFTRTEEQAAAAVAVVTMLLAILGGTFFPVNMGPELLSRIAFLTPHAWFLRGISDAATGGSVVTVTGPVAVLLAIGIVSGGLGLLRMRRLVLA